MTSIDKKFASKLTLSQINKVVDVSKRLGFNPNWLLGVMYFETGRTFDPSITNAYGSVGLIQFTRDKSGANYKTIGGVKYHLSVLAQMTFEEQMEVVYQYYNQVKGNKAITSFVDVYMLTFFPAAVGKPNNYVLQTSGLSASLIAAQNPAFDTNNDNKITKGEVEAYFKNIWKYNFQNNTAPSVDFPKYGLFGALIVSLVLLIKYLFNL